MNRSDIKILEIMAKSKQINKKTNKKTSKDTKHSVKPKKPVLGRGLGALLPSIEFSKTGFALPKEEQENKLSNFANIDIMKIVQNPYQPRKEFDEASLEDLKKSIIENGVIQAITVRRSINGYELISGERRLRASVLAKKKTIPAYILEVKEDVDMLELALIENVQRENLNPIETATGFQRLIEECDLTQEQVAVKIGKDRSTITNFLRLLKLPQKIQDSLRRKEITMGHARSLLSLANTRNMLFAWKEIIGKQLSVRVTESLVKDINKEKILTDKTDGNLTKDNSKNKTHLSSETLLVIKEQEKKLMHAFGTRITINTKSKESGSIKFDFYSIDDFERLIELFNYVEDKMK